MMKLSTMWNVVRSLGEDWSCPPAEIILERWGFDPGSVKYFRASANTLCTFQRDGKPHFLRFNLDSERPLAMVEAEVNLVRWLDEQGVQVAAPVPSRTDQLVETVETQLGTVHAVVFTALAGAHREMAELGEAGFRTWGGALGRLHAAMKAYPAPDGRPTWRDQLELARPYIRENEPGLLAEWHQLADWAASLPTGSENFGLIHFDFELDNLCWQDGRIAILDFDDCVQSWYVADIAYALRDLFEDGIDLGNPLFQAFLAGYEEHHAVNRELLAQLPMFMRFHTMYLFGRLSRSLDLPAGEHYPEWLSGLNAKLQGRVNSYRESF